MAEKNSNLNMKIEIHKDHNDVRLLIDKKLDFFKDIVQKTIIHIQNNKFLDILGISDVSACIDRLNEVSKKIKDVQENNSKPNISKDALVNELQSINNDLSSLLKTYGTQSLEDLITICFGTSGNKIPTNENDTVKYDLLKKYFHPVSYKLVNKKDDTKQKKSELIDEKMKHLDCYDVASNYKQFHMKVYGIKLFIYNDNLKKGLIVNGIVDDIIIDFLSNTYINTTKNEIIKNVPQEDDFKGDAFDKFIASLTLKDYLICIESVDIYNKFAGYLSQYKSIKMKQISVVVKEFINEDMYTKRNTLIHLLIKSQHYENQYLAYLLYDLLSNDTNGNVDTQEQTIIFDSFPWTIKQHFKQAMKKTIQYTNELSNFDINKIPLEQQICLLKAPDNVKEKAMMKLKEVKAKSEDSGSKARQYLDGLLKIPFNIYKKEPVLTIMDSIKSQFKNLYKNYDINTKIPEIPLKEKYTSIEILKYIKIIRDNLLNKNEENILDTLMTGDKKTLMNNIVEINEFLKKNKLKNSRIKTTYLSKEQLKEEICKFIHFCKLAENIALYEDTKSFFNKKISVLSDIQSIKNDVDTITNQFSKITEYMTNVKDILDKSVYGHDKAKRQIERIFAQWVNGEQKASAYGFEGPPGVGKTSLAKGLANCLKDENGVSRPFSLIAIGGDANSSSLVGHSYTYVGSSWGQIVQILMDKKCMNPIILIDEVDKISKTEHGKEIIGVLTHLLDPTQNEMFQDKYFSGIELDLSKVLFILSYNDVNSIDRIMLDRVHRIKFDNLSLEDKIVICNKHLLPDIYKNVGLEDMIHFSDETLKFIIKEYTLEAGVRKLKEILFEIVGEINLDILKNNNKDIAIPFEVVVSDIKSKYFKDKREAKIYKVHNESRVGLINALWANEMKQGGVLPLQIRFVPSSKFLDLTLTGSLGDVMKESISVSLTNAWNLTSIEKQKELIKKYNNPKENEVYGLHVHCPSISTPKDGPSATTAFTVAIYSLLNNIKIKNYFGITGETSFDYILTEIGGLQEKIINSIPAGIKEFIFPVENQSDFDKIMEKYKGNELLQGIKFHAVNKIEDVLELILDK